MDDTDEYRKKATVSDDDDGDPNPEEGEIVTEVPIPQFIEMILAVTRLSELQVRIAEERAEREKETYQNPYPIMERIISSMRFDGAIASLILLNCLALGVQASWPDNSADAVWTICENFFVFAFLIEWCARIRVFGWVWVFEWSNAGDTFIVFFTGVIPKWILEPMGTDVTMIRILTVFRTLRLVRIVRSARHLPQCRELWFLMQGLLQSARPLLWISVIAVMILYIFGIAATELIGRQYRNDDHIQALFGNPLKSMFTMLQVMTLDSWAYQIARPVMEKDFYLGLFFVGFIMLAVFVFGNLVTAVIVEKMLKIAKAQEVELAKEAEKVKKKNIQVLNELLTTIDADNSGMLSTEEFMAALDNPKVKTMLDCIDVPLEDLEEVWSILDDGDGIITIKDFKNGLRRTKGNAKAKDIVEIIKRLRQTGVRHAELHSEVRRFNETVQAVEYDVQRIQLDTSEVLGLFQEIYFRLDAHIKKEQGEDRMFALQQARLREQEPASDDEGAEAEDERGAPSPPTSPTGAGVPPTPTSPAAAASSGAGAR